MYIVEIASDVVLDLFMSSMPLPMIKQLSTSRERQWMLGGFFWLGTCTYEYISFFEYLLLQLLRPS